MPPCLIAAKRCASITRSAGSCLAIAYEKARLRLGVHVATGRPMLVELPLDVQSENMHEVLGIRDDAERLMGSAVLQLAHDELE